MRRKTTHVWLYPHISEHRNHLVGSAQRRRINTEEKAKVVASAGGGGTEFIQFLAALAILQ